MPGEGIKHILNYSGGLLAHSSSFVLLSRIKPISDRKKGDKYSRYLTSVDLSSILKSKTSCLHINSNELNENTFFKFKTKEALIIENLDEKISEKLLFSLWNIALQDNKYLLITSRKPINSYKFKLNDLISRVNSSLIIGINLPSDDLISVILTKNFSDKQIKVEKKHIDYIIKRIDRSYEKISQFILTLDKYSLKKGSPFSLKLIKEVLKMI